MPTTKILTCFHHETKEEFEEVLEYLIIPRIGDCIAYKNTYYIVKEFVHELDRNEVFIIVELEEE